MLFRLTRLLLVLGAIIGISALHIVSVNVLEFPFSLINFVMLFALLLLFILETGLIVWTAAFAFFILDLYSAITPFGVIFFSGTISVLLAYWFHTAVFTNRSWYAAGALTLIALLLYRLLFAMAIFVLEQAVGLDVRWADTVIAFLWEFLLTALLASVTIFVLSFFIRGLRTRAIEDSLFVIRRRG